MSFYRSEKPFPRKTKTRVCPGCGVLLDPSDTSCFQCQTPVSPVTFPETRLWVKRNIRFQGQVTFALLILNFFLFIVSWVLSSNSKGFLMNVDLGVLNRLGAKSTPLILEGELWRFVTANFLHANLMHIFFNMMAFLSLGRLAEELYGWRLYLFFYTVSGIVGYMASSYFYPHVLGIGASGAIMGLAGVLIATSLKHWRTYGQVIGKSLLRWVAYILIIGFFLSNYIDNAAHVGGLLAGFLISLLFWTADTPGFSWKKWIENVLGWGTILALSASFTAMALLR